MLWRISSDADISDGWGNYPSGVLGEYTANVKVQ